MNNNHNNMWDQKKIITEFSFFFNHLYIICLFAFNYNDNNNGKDNRTPWLVVVYKIKIMRRDKKIVVVIVDDAGGAAAFLNIMSK